MAIISAIEAKRATARGDAAAPTMHVHAALVAAVLLVAPAAASYVSLDLGYSGDAARVPTRALLVDVALGVPERRRSLMLDFGARTTELDQCVFTESVSYERVDNSSGNDLVLFESVAELVAAAPPRGYYRLPLREHCADQGYGMAAAFYEACADHGVCEGVLGMAPLSALWDVWSAYTLTIDELLLGRGHPRRREQLAAADSGSVARWRRHVRCSGDVHAETMCSFRARLAGRRVWVDVHTEDSYVRVPQALYVAYMRHRDMAGVTGSGHRTVMGGGTANRTDPFEVDADTLQRASAFYRLGAASTERYAHLGWPPLVLHLDEDWCVSDELCAPIVLDPELLVHVPSTASSYAGHRTSSQRFFGDHATSTNTLLLKPHDGADRVSIGNNLLRRFVLHKDQLRGRLVLDERIMVDHMSATELVVFLFLFLVYLRECSKSTADTAAFGLGIVPACAHCHREVWAHVALASSAPRARAALVVAVRVAVVAAAAWAARHAYSFLADGFETFFAWALALTSVNAAALLVATLYEISLRRRSLGSGAFCWRSFRFAHVVSASMEHVLLLGMLLLALVKRRDDLGTLLGTAAALALFYNAARHLVAVAVYSWSLANRHAHAPAVESPSTTARTRFPSPRAQLVWLVYVSLVLFGANMLATTWLLATRVVYAYVRSVAALAFVYTSAASLAVGVVAAFVKKAMAEAARRHASAGATLRSAHAE